jgi:hypothetical protein
VAVPDFFFTLEFSSQAAPASLIEDLAASVFKYVHCAEENVEGMSEALERATASGPSGAGRCDVQFRARGGELEVLISSNGGRVWQKSILIPAEQS